jgi:acyl-CoA synthetase (AMP-forming)/AMP-acid ligase II
MTGYRGDPEATAEVLQDGWFRTSDMGRLDHGILRVLGRADDVIVTGGEKVDPSEVEAALEEHESVVEAMVMGEPDAFWGERVIALVVHAPNTEPADLRTFLREKLAAYKIPKEFRPVFELPRLPSGKLRRRPPQE